LSQILSSLFASQDGVAGGFTPFNFEVTGLIKPGENSIVVKVDNKRMPDGVPAINTDWWNYGGITRGFPDWPEQHPGS